MLSLWQMSLSASAVILLTALLRRVAGSRLPRRMYVAMWDVAALASLIPFRVPWATLSQLVRRWTARPVGNILNGLPSAIPGVTTQPLLAAPTLTAVAADELPTVSLAVTEAMPGARQWRDGLTTVLQSARATIQAVPDRVWQAAGILWLAGAILLAVVLLWRWLVCLRAFSEALPCGDERVSAFLREHRLLRPIRVRLSNRVASPLSYGLWRPVILLPSAIIRADDRTLAYVLTHEFMHIRAWDMLRKEALLTIVCLHWPNPLVWLMLRLFSRDMELMCDERVVRRLGGRKAYCLTLLDMETQRSNLTMGTCFSVTGIEERIQVMKNRKHQSILSIALACAIFLGAAAGAMTGIPSAGAENASPRMFVSQETWETCYAKYEPYGLAYDAENGVITYHGQIVRYFEDMWPVGDQGKSGACFLYDGGTVDVYGVREFPETIHRNPDGSFDPSGILTGLREATQEEYAERTARNRAACLSLGGATEYLDAYQLAEAIVVASNDMRFTFSSDPNIRFIVDDKQNASASQLDVEWWTAEDYREWLEAERLALQELVGSEARSWTPSTGWFTWTQEKVDETIARYESILRDIEAGALVSRSINEKEANMVLMQGNILSTTIALDPATPVAEAIPSEDISDDAVVETLEQEALTFGFATRYDSADLAVSTERDLGSDEELPTYLVAVSPDDEWRFTPEEWNEILKLVEIDAVQWADSSEAQAARISYDAQMARMEGWRETIAPYAPFGLSYALDTATDLVHLYWNGREVRGVFDPQLGAWITDHTGISHYPDGAKELIAVYENGRLAGLREADAEESAVWDKLRQENTNNR